MQIPEQGSFGNIVRLPGVLDRPKKLNHLGSTEDLEEGRRRFWERVEIGKPDDCWNWKLSLSGGYGCAYVFGPQIKAHRIAFWLAFGFDAGPWCVCHKCDNPACCNPSHFFLGNQLDNMRDCKSKNRHAKMKGERNGNSKLTNAQVMKIRKRYKYRKYSFKKVAGDFGISPTLVRCIVSGVNWRHVQLL